MSSDRLILVADDQEGIRTLIKEILEESYSVLVAENGPGAVEIVKKQPVDLVLLDIKMSGMSGLEALSLIKQVKPKVPVIMISGFNDPETLSQVLKRGAQGCLLKPFEIEDMLDKIEDVLNKHETQNQVFQD
ncbi:response regulator [Candidatus Contubernalis alkaliaceticus]|uniref:response regulator n=1 Tax=Candidatus Contubernalis alkaliaceticus TaxID=338645 RepID=UPI001F4C26F0|nr:response regulator [Candidatus Contubernalis alkalaceticus]UNC93690.1 response regulator [Candidatus Contubernalis alkalaceticus]